MTIRNSAAFLAGISLLSIAQFSSAQTPAQRDSTEQSAISSPSDNTKSNKVDPSNSRMTADDQKNDASDLALTRQIRKNIMADKTLSTYAHNVKIVAAGGKVTLNGVVRTAEEKTRVAAIAAQVAGRDRVVDEMKVAPAKS